MQQRPGKKMGYETARGRVKYRRRGQHAILTLYTRSGDVWVKVAAKILKPPGKKEGEPASPP